MTVKANKPTCMPADTLAGEVGVRYIASDSDFAIRVIINGIDSTLGYRFVCSAPPVLVPVVYAIDKDVVCLRRGYGQDFDQFIICYAKDNEIIVKEFEIALTVDLKHNMVVYRNYDSLDQIEMENFKTDRRNVFNIPARLTPSHIYDAKIKRDRLILMLSDDRRLIIPYTPPNDTGKTTILKFE